MALDIGHEWAGDLLVGPTGDLAAASGSGAVTQRILRRLLTNLGDYIWNPTYGAGLPGFVGTPELLARVGAIVRQQLALEASVALSPAPDVSVAAPDGSGTGTFEINIQYVDVPNGQLVATTVPVTG